MSEPEGKGSAGPILAMIVVGILVVGGLGALGAIVVFKATPSVSTSTTSIGMPVPPATSGTVTPPTLTEQSPPSSAPGEGEAEPPAEGPQR